MDAKVNLKMKFLDEVKSKTPQESLSGRQWYCQQAYRVSTKLIGRSNKAQRRLWCYYTV
ncbi:regulator of telomere elongation helicase 1-like [Saccoglossus kowalevskii]